MTPPCSLGWLQDVLPRVLWDFLPGWLWDYPLGGTGAALPLGFPPGWLRGDPPSTARALGISFGLNAGCPSSSECFGCTPGMALSLFQHLLRGLLSSSGGDFPPWRPRRAVCASRRYPHRSHPYGARFGDSAGWDGGSTGGDPSTGSHRGAHRRLPEKEQKAPRPSWKKRINKERGTASGFFKLRVSGPVFFSPLARRPAGTLSRRRGGAPPFGGQNAARDGATGTAPSPLRRAPAFMAPRPSAVGIAAISLWKSEMSQRCSRVRVCPQPPTHGTGRPRAR